MKYIVAIVMLSLALFRLESGWAANTTVDAVLLKNKSEPLLYTVLGHLEYQSNQGFIADKNMADSLSELIQTHALNGGQGYAYVINVASSKVTWSTLSSMPDYQKELKAHALGDDVYLQSNEHNYFLAKNFWVKTSNGGKEHFQIVLAINY
ncbi:MAG: hypothetical protein WAQ53_06490 [Thiofilum sp.]|uniref:hypothetical protein n=1 Tax=Thiofilum sp. TaxID=2212733 RepID=UPI0025E669A7|nr:hypothetical protein [Thiofilum sp.]MBK8454983.1 hypothetical protein [Thiofilum sp.]